MNIQGKNNYHRYHIETKTAPDIVPWPNRFVVKVNRVQLAKLLLSEIFHQRGDIKAITSRPCMYGVFSGPIGGFAPRPKFCVGCLRCTTQHPQVVQIYPNPARRMLGDSYFTHHFVDAVTYEASTGSVPVKGAGYRGRFGGEGWDAIWTDMSEIVRPTRDGIHGREFISTSVDIGNKPGYLIFDEAGNLFSLHPNTVSIPLPMIFDGDFPSIDNDDLTSVLLATAEEVDTLVTLPISKIIEGNISSHSAIPIVPFSQQELIKSLQYTPSMIEVLDWPIDQIEYLSEHFPETILCLRYNPGNNTDLMPYFDAGIRCFHILANFHGQTEKGKFIKDAIREVHLHFVNLGIRDEITLIGSGGMIAAEHIPKAIIMGLDVVGIDTPLLVALQTRFVGECKDRDASKFDIPLDIPLEWGKTRLANLCASWRDQLLEILGAMGLREVRRLRGEIGRSMQQVEVEKEAFSGIDGYE